MVDMHWKTSFEKTVFSAWASKLNMSLINKGRYGMFFACGIWCVADVSSVSPSSEQTNARRPLLIKTLNSRYGRLTWILTDRHLDWVFMGRAKFG